MAVSASESPAGTQEPEPAEEWTVALVGRVVDESGAPIEGAELRTKDGIPRARSDPEGHVHALPGAGSPWPKRVGDDATTLQVCAHGHTSRLLSVWVQDGATLHLGTLVLGRGADILGAVRDAGGRPLANASVRLYDVAEWSFEEGEPRSHGLHSDPSLQLTFSDSGGSYCLRGAPVGEVFLNAWAEGTHGAWTEPFVLRAGEDAHHDLTLPSDGRMRVRWSIQVLDPRGAPVPRALVMTPQFGALPGQESRQADGTGRTELEVLVGQQMSVVAKDLDQHWRSSPEEARVGREDASFELVLREPSYLTVVVVDEEQRPIPGSSVFLYEESLGSTVLPTDDRGTLRILLPGSSFQVRGMAPGYAPRRLGPFDPAALAVEEPLILRLSPGLAIGGRVLDGEEPVAGATIALREHCKPDELLHAVGITSDETPLLLTSSISGARGTTDGMGAFVVNVWGDGWYTVVVEASGFPPQAFGPFEVRGRASLEHELPLARGGAIEGRLLLPLGASASGRVVGACGGFGLVITAPVGEDGRYRIDDVAPGGYQVRVCNPPLARVHPIAMEMEERAGRSLELSNDCVVREGATTRFDLDLSAEGSVVLEGSFQAAGLAAKWASILREGEGRACAPAEIDSDGRFLFSLSRPGPYRVQIQTESDSSTVGIFEVPVRLSTGTQRWSATLAVGHVTVVGGSSAVQDFAVAESIVLAWRNDEGASYRIQVFPDGEEQTLLFPAGRVQAIVDEGDRRELDVAAGETVVLDLTR